MSARAASCGRRGQPVAALALLILGWAGARYAFVEFDRSIASPAQAVPVRLAERTPAPAVATPTRAAAAQPASPVPLPAVLPLPAGPAPVAVAPPPLLAEPPLPAPVPARVAAGHQMLWMAALAQMPLPSGIGAGAPTIAPRIVRSDRPAPPRRWSADGWLLLRDGGGPALAGGGSPASYGASQAGAVVRYRLAPASGHRTAAYLRATAALGAAKDREVAAGLSARPLARLPVVAAVELRAADRPGGVAVRPAAFVVTELPPFDLPLGLRGEAYGQAGWVGGKGATAFVDGQLRADRQVVRIGGIDLRAGAGAWGGAQEGASRVDVGPSATLGLPVGRGSARMAVDWRFRVAGNAAPASGPALTLSAGF